MEDERNKLAGAHPGVVSPGRVGFLVPGFGGNLGMRPSQTHPGEEGIGEEGPEKTETRAEEEMPRCLPSLSLSWGVGASSLDGFLG